MVDWQRFIVDAIASYDPYLAAKQKRENRMTGASLLLGD
jgi:hypothetical protein